MRRAILIDIGGVLMADHLPEAAAAWSRRLGISRRAFLTALFRDSDDQVLTGKVSESRWWDVVASRLDASTETIAALRQDLAARQHWDQELVGLMRGIRGQARTAVVSNAWPQTRIAMDRAGLLGLVDEIVLSCEVGYAKPDARMYWTALDRLGAAPGDTLFVDDTPDCVAAAQQLGITGHVHTATPATITRIQDFLGADFRETS